MVVANIPYWCDEAAEEQFYEKRRHLGLAHKEANNFRKIADGDIAEARTHQELFPKCKMLRSQIRILPLTFGCLCKRRKHQRMTFGGRSRNSVSNLRLHESGRECCHLRRPHCRRLINVLLRSWLTVVAVFPGMRRPPEVCALARLLMQSLLFCALPWY